MTTIYDVSELAGVSLATVSRVMNKNANVSDKTRQKVVNAMEQLGYRPSAIAKGLASNRSSSVGVLISELHGPFYGSMMSAVEAELRKFDIHAIIAAGHSNAEKEAESIEFLLTRRCDALILWVESVPDRYLVELAKRDTPIVVLGRKIAKITKNCVSLNNEEGGYLAARYLLEQGHRKIAYISGPLWKGDTQDRLSGHKRALAEYGVKFNTKLHCEGDYREEGGFRGMTELLGLRNTFSAVVCGNDEMAAGAMTSARDAGLSIPEDLSVVGFDNLVYARYLYPKLSTINYPVREMAQMAARWVLKHVYKNQRLVATNIFEPELVARDSVQQFRR
ncbi:LacI family DNA-binding transcriptional regulator [Exilibacterium tricleocarpae]|uniref:LacI family DNA-binding transcriptional regulator n=1 Tax=Exilibacterium tricleocarpae TaxID=2591008 RepID=A0A545SM91_9GAMM|nr:LacI family DNA-binding transcriptional regulator [Exilibacterium tricleocarpae]TQV65966.1 LacI family DNA-binding transcriptional regulator [Exilibacterium tricleocarpae]